MLHITVIAKRKSKEKNIKVGLQVKREKEIAARGWMGLWKSDIWKENESFSVPDAHSLMVQIHIFTYIYMYAYVSICVIIPHIFFYFNIIFYQYFTMCSAQLKTFWNCKKCSTKLKDEQTWTCLLCRVGRFNNIIINILVVCALGFELCANTEYFK